MGGGCDGIGAASTSTSTSTGPASVVCWFAGQCGCGICGRWWIGLWGCVGAEDVGDGVVVDWFVGAVWARVSVDAGRWLDWFVWLSWRGSCGAGRWSRQNQSQYGVDVVGA